MSLIFYEKFFFLVPDSNNLCKLCDDTCESCFAPLDPNACSTCDGIRYLLNTTCVLDCGDGF